jgi:hypothetical protein
VLTATVRRWAAWAPRCTTPQDWRAWSDDPGPVGTEGHPDASFLPALLRRRCTPLTRIMLAVAFACCDEAERGAARSVFASRHGSINESLGMLEGLARGERLSPAKFSHTVHNAQAGLFSIAAANREASSSLSAGSDTFGCAYLEALTHLEREPTRPVLLVMGDVPLAPTFAPLVVEPAASYGLALLLTRAGNGPRLDFTVGASAQIPGDARPWPDTLEFLRWLLGSERALALSGTRCTWTWIRTDPALSASPAAGAPPGPA